MISHLETRLLAAAGYVDALDAPDDEIAHAIEMFVAEDGIDLGAGGRPEFTDDEIDAHVEEELLVAA